MKIKLPIKLIDEINKSIDQHPNLVLTTKKHQNLFNKLLELWYFVYNKQISDSTKTLIEYTNIHKEDLDKFRVMINGDLIRYNTLLSFIPHLIEINHTFSQGNFTKGYRIKTEFLQGNLHEVEIDINFLYENMKTKDYWLEKYPELSQLIHNTYQLELDLDSFIEYTTNNFNKEIRPIVKNGFIVKRYIDYEFINYCINYALKFKHKNIWFKLSNEGRFYNSITNMPSELIEFISINGQKLYSIDVVNCQPLLLSSLLGDNNFKLDVENGIFYDVLKTHLNINRNECKLLVYSKLLFNHHQMKSGKLYDALESLYPGLVSKINLIKNDLSLRLQEIESRIFIGKMKNLNKYMVIRHDEVLVLERDIDFFKVYIRNCFKQIKLNVKLK